MRNLPKVTQSSQDSLEGKLWYYGRYMDFVSEEMDKESDIIGGLFFFFFFFFGQME